MKRALFALLAACEPATVSAPDASTDDIMACGNGLVDEGELCDAGASLACGELGSTWSGGTATCRTSCAGWDVSACTRANVDQWETVEPAMRDPRFATARCNDGSPFDFKVRLAAQPTKIWVIHLEGGAFCDDFAHPCAERTLDLTTTSPEADRALTTTTGRAIVSRDPAINVGFAGANHVQATYCSSDLFAGATTERRPTQGDPANGWYFSGHANIAAMLAVLAERYGLDDADSETNVLFGGSSAGALGAHLNSALVEAALPNAATQGRLRLFIDAGWLIDWRDPDPAPPDYYIATATAPDAEVWRRARALWGATFDPACEATEAEPSRCLMGPVWYPHVAARVPVLVQQSPLDSTFAREHGIDTSAPNPTAAAWRQQVEASFAATAWLFSGNAPYHVLAMTDPTFLRGPTGSRLTDVVARFGAGGAAERVEW